MNKNGNVARSGASVRKVVMFLVLIAVCGAGLYAYSYRLGKPQREFIAENLVTVSIADSAISSLGEPIEMGEPVAVRDGKKLTVKTPVSGPNAKGIVVLTGTLSDSGWSQDDLFLEIDGVRVELETLDDLIGLDFSEGE